jgi:hypothetical protein
MGNKNLRHQLHRQNFQGPTPSSLFAGLRSTQINLENPDDRAQSIIDRTIQLQYFKNLKARFKSQD